MTPSIITKISQRRISQPKDLTWRSNQRITGSTTGQSHCWRCFPDGIPMDQDTMGERHTERNAESPYWKPTKAAYRDTNREVDGEVDREVYREVDRQSLPSLPRFTETPAQLESASARRLSSGTKDQGEKITGKRSWEKQEVNLHIHRDAHRVAHRETVNQDVYQEVNWKVTDAMFRTTLLRRVYNSMPIADDCRYV